MHTPERLYKCEICHHVNSVVRFHCSCCGTIPRQYSWTGLPIKGETTQDIDGNECIASTITVHVASGAERANQFRTVKANLRTVPLDYYAQGV